MACVTPDRPDTVSAVDCLLDAVERTRVRVSAEVDRGRRSEMGQFLTPVPTGLFMAEMFSAQRPVLRVLDPGAGIGSLSAAFVAAMCRREKRPKEIALTACENDPNVIDRLHETLSLCRSVAGEMGVSLKTRVLKADFIEYGLHAFSGDLFGETVEADYDCVIMNPPYRKIRADSKERGLLRADGIEVSNLYAGFLAVSARLLAPEGELVAITPRSFCNGPYFEPFRRQFLSLMRFRNIHVFELRDRAFSDDKVLQENIIFRAAKTRSSRLGVLISSSVDPAARKAATRILPHEEVVFPHDHRCTVHIMPKQEGAAARRRVEELTATLAEVGLEVSTGRVVDFRVRQFLRDTAEPGTAPLVYPCHFARGCVEWPNATRRKPNALVLSGETASLLVPSGYYVLTRRFSAKEERRRVVAAVYDPRKVPAEHVAFENHLNYYHVHGAGMDELLARGLSAFLNSSLVDTCFRQFSGHTQVNATDLRMLRYPARDQLMALGDRIGPVLPAQDRLDAVLQEMMRQW